MQTVNCVAGRCTHVRNCIPHIAYRMPHTAYELLPSNTTRAREEVFLYLAQACQLSIAWRLRRWGVWREIGLWNGCSGEESTSVSIV
jgi:hypothetical protein